MSKSATRLARMNDPSEAGLGQPGPFQLLSGLIRPKKFGLDPTLQAIALYLGPVPIAPRNFEARPFGRAPKKSSIQRWCRPDVYAGALQVNHNLLLRSESYLARRAASGTRQWGNLGSGLDNAGRGKIGPRDGSWCCK